MKKPWLAALLNIIPGLGYIYLNTRRLLGWMLLGSFAAFCISLYDPAVNSGNNTAPSGIWNLWYALFFLLPWAGFIIDGYIEARKQVVINEKQAVRARKGRSAAGGIAPELFVILSFVTLGMYQVYWSWRLWETVRRSRGETYRFRSSLRGVTNGISNFWLFPRLRDLAVEKGYKSRIDVELLAAAYLLLSFVAGLPFTPLIALPFLALGYSVIMLPIVDMQNYYAEATRSKYAPAKANWWLIAFLIVIFALSTVALGLNSAQH